MRGTLDRLFLEYSIDKLRQYESRIGTCLALLSEEQIWMRDAGGSGNAVGNLVLHLSGNVRQWIGSGVGDRPGLRDRDAEFAARGGMAGAELASLLKDAVSEAVDVLGAVTAERLSERITVQNHDVSVLEAIYHVVEHFSMHTGQIFFATKLLTGTDLGFYRPKPPLPTHEENP